MLKVMPIIDTNRLNEVFNLSGLPLDSEKTVQFKRYSELLCEWNEKMNLTAITDSEGIAVKHFLDSCLPLSMVDVPTGATVIDVGTGAGFPGVPMKILRSDISLALLDSLNKRLTFLSAVLDDIGLKAELIHSRAEDKGASALRESFDIATARAVARLSVLCEYCLPFVKVGGAFLALKGPDAKHEVDEARSAIKLLGGRVEAVKEYSLPGGDKRTLIVIAKTAPTPKRFPRKKGIADSPIG